MPPSRRPAAKRKAPLTADYAEPTPLPRDAALAKQKQRKRFVWSERLHVDFISAVFDVGLHNASAASVHEMLPATSNGMQPEDVEGSLKKLRLFRIHSHREANPGSQHPFFKMPAPDGGSTSDGRGRSSYGGGNNGSSANSNAHQSPLFLLGNSGSGSSGSGVRGVGSDGERLICSILDSGLCADERLLQVVTDRQQKLEAARAAVAKQQELCAQAQRLLAGVEADMQQQQQYPQHPQPYQQHPPHHHQQRQQQQQHPHPQQEESIQRHHRSDWGAPQQQQHRYLADQEQQHAHAMYQQQWQHSQHHHQQQQQRAYAAHYGQHYPPQHYSQHPQHSQQPHQQLQHPLTGPSSHDANSDDGPISHGADPRPSAPFSTGTSAWDAYCQPPPQQGSSQAIVSQPLPSHLHKDDLRNNNGRGAAQKAPLGAEAPTSNGIVGSNGEGDHSGTRGEVWGAGLSHLAQLESEMAEHLDLHRSMVMHMDSQLAQYDSGRDSSVNSFTGLDHSSTRGTPRNAEGRYDSLDRCLAASRSLRTNSGSSVTTSGRIGLSKANSFTVSSSAAASALRRRSDLDPRDAQSSMLPSSSLTAATLPGARDARYDSGMDNSRNSLSLREYRVQSAGANNPRSSSGNHSGSSNRGTPNNHNPSSGSGTAAALRDANVGSLLSIASEDVRDMIELDRSLDGSGGNPTANHNGSGSTGGQSRALPANPPSAPHPFAAATQAANATAASASHHHGGYPLGHNTSSSSGAGESSGSSGSTNGGSAAAQGYIAAAAAHGLEGSQATDSTFAFLNATTPAAAPAAPPASAASAAGAPPLRPLYGARSSSSTHYPGTNSSTAAADGSEPRGRPPQPHSYTGAVATAATAAAANDDTGQSHTTPRGSPPPPLFRSNSGGGSSGVAGVAQLSSQVFDFLHSS